MTVVTPPTIVPNAGHPPDDDLDGLLRAYFQAELPDPWPSFEAPLPRHGVPPLRRSQAPRFTLWRSRLALAAAILLLVVGALFLIGGSGNTNAPVRSGMPGLPGASRDPLPERGPNIVIDKNGAHLEQELPLDFLPMK